MKNINNSLESESLKSKVISLTNIHSAKTYTHLDKKQDEHILHKDTTKIKTKVQQKNHSPLENEWSKFNHKDWYCQGLAKRVFSPETKHDLEKKFGSNITDIIYQCIGSNIALSDNSYEYHEEINNFLNESISKYNQTYDNIKVSKIDDDYFFFQIDNYRIDVEIDNRVSITTTKDDIEFYSNNIRDSLNNVITESISHENKESINSDIFYNDISNIKHDNWLYINMAKNNYSLYDNDRLVSILDNNQLNFVYECIGTQYMLKESKKRMSLLDRLEVDNLDAVHKSYDVVSKNISYLENHLFELSQKVNEHNDIKFNIEDGEFKSFFTSSYYIDINLENDSKISIRKKFKNHIDKVEYKIPNKSQKKPFKQDLQYKQLIGNGVEDIIHGVSSVDNIDDDDSISNTTLNMTSAVKNVPSVYSKFTDISNNLEEHIKNDYNIFKESSGFKDGTKNVIKHNIKTGVDKGISSAKDFPKKIATSVGEKVLNTKPNLSTSTDTGIDGIKTAVTSTKTTVDTAKTVNNTVVAGKKFITNIKNTPKSISKDINNIKKTAEKLKVVITTVGKSSVGIIVACLLVILLIIPVLAENTVTTVLTSVSSLFGWLQDSEDVSKNYLEVLYGKWKYIDSLLTEVQTTYDTTVNSPMDIDSNWKKSFERFDSEKHLYGYHDTIMGEKYNYKEISLNVLSALAIDKYNELVDNYNSTSTSNISNTSSNNISLEFTDKEIQDKLKLFYETEYKETTFYCNNSVLSINVAYDECKSYNYFNNVFNTTSEKSFLYGGNYITSDNAIYMHIDGENDWRNIHFTPKYYEIWANQDNFLLHEINGNGYLYGNGTHMYVIGEASFTDGSHIYCVRFSGVEDGGYPSYDDIYFLYSSDSMSYNFGGDIQVLDVNCSGHKEISCYIATKIKDKITAEDLGFTDEEYELFLVVKEELKKIIDNDNPNKTVTITTNITS